MAYKDKGKQREADRERQRRYRAERGRQAYPKGVTESGRDKAKGVTKQGVTQGVTKEWQTVTTETSTMPNCKYCGKQLDYSILSCCYECSLKQVFPKTTRFPTRKQSKDKPYQMTVMERLFYRPASKLGRGETNFVSLPGRACYGVV